MMSFHPEVGGCETNLGRADMGFAERALCPYLKKKKSLLYFKFNLTVKHLIISIVIINTNSKE